MLTEMAQVRRAGDLVFVAGQVDTAAHDVAGQTAAVLTTIKDLLGSSLRDVVDVFAYVKDPRWCLDVLEAARPFFPVDPRPGPSPALLARRPPRTRW